MNLSFWLENYFSESKQVQSGLQTGRLHTVNLFFGLVGPTPTRIYLFRLTKIMLFSFKTHFFQKFRFFVANFFHKNYQKCMFAYTLT